MNADNGTQMNAEKQRELWVWRLRGRDHGHEDPFIVFVCVHLRAVICVHLRYAP
jgi:hypothetical protein